MYLFADCGKSEIESKNKEKAPQNKVQYTPKTLFARRNLQNYILCCQKKEIEMRRHFVKLHIVRTRAEEEENLVSSKYHNDTKSTAVIQRAVK